MSTPELDTVIADAVDDAFSGSIDTSSDAPDTSADTGSVDVASVDDDTSSVVDSTSTAPGASTPSVEDEFSKKWGIPAQSVTGRENRIPHSRVKTMVTKAEQEGYQRGLKEAEGKTSPQFTELQGKVKEYETHLQRVAQFEQVLENDPRTFLTHLSQHPAYKEFFDYISQLAAQAQPQQEQPILSKDGMPEPDETLADGSRIYSLEGLRKRDEWLARQVREQAVREAEDRFAKRLQPIEQERAAQRAYQEHMARVVPLIERQIADARTWPGFAEHEAEIVAALKADPNLSLERAYQNVYLPKVSTDRNKIRQEVLDELKRKPVSTATPTSSARPTAGNEPKSLDDIIAAEVAKARRAGVL